MRRSPIGSIVGAFLLAFLVLAPARPAHGALVTLEFTGTYQVLLGNLFGLPGPTVPFAYQLTYDTTLDTNTTVLPPGSPLGAEVTANAFHGYSASGIVATHLVLGTQTWTTADLQERLLGPGVTADFWLDVDLATATPTRAYLQFTNAGGTLTIGGATNAGGLVGLDTGSQVTGVLSGWGVTPAMTITATPVAVPIPEPGAISLLAAGLIGLAVRPSRARCTRARECRGRRTAP